MTNHVDKHDKAFQVDIASYALPTFHSTRQDLVYIVLLCKRLVRTTHGCCRVPFVSYTIGQRSEEISQLSFVVYVSNRL